MELSKLFRKFVTDKQKLVFNAKKRNKLGYIARNLETNKVFYSSGAAKIADLVGCTSSNLYKYLKKKDKKIFLGWEIEKTIDLPNKNRGKNIKVGI